MIKRYIKNLDMELSPLGFGVMRLPMVGDNFTEESYKLMDLAMDAGINYYDTAYWYQKNRSEEFIRNTLVSKYPRDKFHIADKLPVWGCADIDDMERIFKTQLERLGTDYIDLYLLHALHKSRWIDIYNKGILNFLESKRKSGEIRKIGFSLHDTTETLVSIVDAYNWDFVQLQINYYDWTIRHADKSYAYLAQRDIPCIVMEPVGGGRLSKLPKNAEKLLKNMHPNNSISSWAVRYAASLSNVVVTLSGMSNAEQLQDNILSFDPVMPMTNVELDALNRVVNIISSYNIIPCTSCRYCTDECPIEIDIPYILQIYNDGKIFDNAEQFAFDYRFFIPENKKANLCVSCGKCVEKCPQGIDIPYQLKTVHNTAVCLTFGFDIEKFKNIFCKQKNTFLVCFGAGAFGKVAQSLLSANGFKVDYFCDNARHLWGSKLNGIPVISPKHLQKLASQGKLSILITSSCYDEIKNKLERIGIEFDIINDK